MRARRLAAVVVAVVLIVGAVLVRRNVIDADDDDPPVPTDATTTTTPAPAAPTQLVCLSEFADVCAELAAEHPELDVDVEDGLVTLDRLAALDDVTAAPLWLTIAPFPAMIDGIRASTSADPLSLGGDPLAATQLAVAAPASTRFDVLGAACPDVGIWRCLGEQAGAAWTDLGGDAAWGTVRPSVGRAERSPFALAAVAAAVAGYLGTPTYSRSTWELDPGFVGWARRLARAVPATALSGSTPLATMATRPPLDVAATTTVELAALDPASERFVANYPQPAMWVEVVLAAPAGADSALASDASTALTAAGWSAPADATTPLPSATTMLALRQLWTEAT